MTVSKSFICVSRLQQGDSQNVATTTVTVATTRQLKFGL